MLPVFKIKYKKYPKFLKAVENRYRVYNETLDFIDEEKKKNKAFVIQPKYHVSIGRLEKDKEKLRALYKQGYNDARDCYDDLIKFINE